ncbi:hypothetical protein IWQ62_000587 [Dispira parvispora]|uniref:BD-FAE-like domain-containing protein n=1 Tax=Dispira parvispora TaxID=1520584 RepID=A0A9W8AZV8_9FUNG|nr:hypothetical protein IWQ62_000587 [Dispira parvispora]
MSRHTPSSRHPNTRPGVRTASVTDYLPGAGQMVNLVGRCGMLITQITFYVVSGAFLLFFAFPLLSLAYFFAWYLYWRQGSLQRGPWAHRIWSLPWNPVRVIRIAYAALENVSDLFSGPFPIVLRWMVEKLMSRRIPAHTVIRGINYGGRHSKLHYLDIYIPELRPSSDELTGNTAHLAQGQVQVPVLCFVYGKTWSSSQRNVYTPMAHTLRQQGYLVLLPELRRPPTVSVLDTVDDVLQCMTWATQHVAKYGGSPTCIYLMGHGAGAHLATLAASVWSFAASKKMPSPLPVGLHSEDRVTLRHRTPSRGTDLDVTTGEGSESLPLSPRDTPPSSSAHTSPTSDSPPSPTWSNRIVTSQDKESLGHHLNALVHKYSLLWTSTSPEPIQLSLDPTPPLHIAGLILLAGVYDIDDQRRYERRRGIDELSATTRLLGSCASGLLSPSLLLESLCNSTGKSLSQLVFPKKVLLIHGERDTMFPLKSSEHFFDLLCQLDVEDANFKIYSKTRSMNPAITLLTESTSLCQSLLEDLRITIYE